jgi:HD-GYP domain-containing protein (c-di-GMP phosphodiesterase class II)
MGTRNGSGLSKVSAGLDRLRDHIGKQIDAAAERPRGESSQSEPDERAILRVIPDVIFHIKRNGTVSVLHAGRRSHVSTHVPAPRRTSADAAAKLEGQPKADEEPQDLISSLAEELARRSKHLLAKATQTGRAQTLELQIQSDGKTTYYEVRAVPYNRTEILAVARDITKHREAENALKKSEGELEAKAEEQSTEVTRLKEAFQKEVALRTDKEETLRKSSQRLEDLLNETIGAITLIVQKKDPYTAGHQQRVSELACAIGREMGLEAEPIRVIRIAALLHDLGKVFIPAEILAKPGRLNKAEFSMIKAHPDADYEILRTIDFSGGIADIVHQHHERLDGSGYPLGLSGDAILMEAKIIAVADVVEAMISDRPHRPSQGLDAALKEIAEGKGTLYDPDAVDACIRLLTEGKFYFGQDKATSTVDALPKPVQNEQSNPIEPPAGDTTSPTD